MKSHIIKKPVVTEKSLQLANTQNIYTFEVAREANKNQIKTAIEKLFQVKVEALNTVTHFKVKKRTGRKRTPVMQAPTKKALIKIKEGQTIKLFDIGSQE